MEDQGDLFKNTTTGWIGVTKRNNDGKMKGAIVPPGETVWLTEEEQRATANAPRSAEDNPFLRRPPMKSAEGEELRPATEPALILVEESSADARRPIGRSEQPAEPIVAA